MTDIHRRMLKVILVILAYTLFANAPARAQDCGCGPRQTLSFRSIDVVSNDVGAGRQPLDSASLDPQVEAMLSSDQRGDSLLNGALIGGVLGGAAGIYVFRGWSAFASNDPGTKETITGFIIGGALGASVGMLIDALF